jgi:hypothetical protein
MSSGEKYVFAVRDLGGTRFSIYVYPQMLVLSTGEGAFDGLLQAG